MAGKRDKPGDEGLLDRFANLNIWRRGDERAPHKPLLLLYALARLQRGEPRPVSFEELDEHVRHLLMEFGPPRKSFHPEYPFWHLQSDRLWEIPQLDELTADLERRSRKNNPSKSVLIRFAGEPIRGPQPGCPAPAHHHLEWHRNEVFRDPPRQLPDL